jgi:hypothetical protein
VADEGINRYETFTLSVLVTMRPLIRLEPEAYDKEGHTLLSDVVVDLHIDIPAGTYYDLLNENLCQYELS